MTTVSFTFDDNLKSHRQIAHLLEKFGFYGSFFVNPNPHNQNFKNGLCDPWDAELYIDLYKRGHEVGSHTYDHYNLTVCDENDLASTIKNAKLALSKIGIKATSFAAPQHGMTVQAKNLILAEHLYLRNESEVTKQDDRIILYLSSSMNLIHRFLMILKGISSGKKIIFIGHGMDGNGWQPVSKVKLMVLLIFCRILVFLRAIKVTTLKDAFDSRK